MKKMQDNNDILEIANPIFKRVVNLSTLTHFKDPKSIAEALLDKDFSDSGLTLIAKAFQEEDTVRREQMLAIIQKNTKVWNTEKVERALDDKGYMYETRKQIIGWENKRRAVRKRIAVKPNPKVKKEKEETPVKIYKIEKKTKVKDKEKLKETFLEKESEKQKKPKRNLTVFLRQKRER